MRGRMLIAAAALFGLGLAACGGDEAHPDVTADRDAASVAAGEAIYQENCAGCHGAALEGGAGPGLVDAELGHPDSDFVEAITNGKGEMPAFGGQLSAEEIASAVDFVRSVQAANLE